LSQQRLPLLSLFPYTTLFRSRADLCRTLQATRGDRRRHPDRRLHRRLGQPDLRPDEQRRGAGPATAGGRSECRRPRLATAAVRRIPGATRSEEHTSELQSRENLVCRLLLEKKNKTTQLDR